MDGWVIKLVVVDAARTVCFCESGADLCKQQKKKGIRLRCCPLHWTALLSISITHNLDVHAHNSINMNMLIEKIIFLSK